MKISSCVAPNGLEQLQTSLVHFPHRQRWALAYAPVFLAGRTGNTTAEQGIHSVSSLFSENKDHAQGVSTLVHMDVERHLRLQWGIAEMRGKLPFRLSKIQQPDLKGCMETFSNLAFSLLQQQIQDAVNYMYKVEVTFKFELEIYQKGDML